MSNLLDKVGRGKLLSGMTIREVSDIADMLQPRQKLDKYDVGIAYLLGVAQGKHSERARRRRATT